MQKLCLVSAAAGSISGFQSLQAIGLCLQVLTHLAVCVCGREGGGVALRGWW